MAREQKDSDTGVRGESEICRALTDTEKHASSAVNTCVSVTVVGTNPGTCDWIRVDKWVSLVASFHRVALCGKERGIRPVSRLG